MVHHPQILYTCTYTRTTVQSRFQIADIYIKISIVPSLYKHVEILLIDIIIHRIVSTCKSGLKKTQKWSTKQNVN